MLLVAKIQYRRGSAAAAAAAADGIALADMPVDGAGARSHQQRGDGDGNGNGCVSVATDAHVEKSRPESLECVSTTTRVGKRTDDAGGAAAENDNEDDDVHSQRSNGASGPARPSRAYQCRGEERLDGMVPVEGAEMV